MGTGIAALRISEMPNRIGDAMEEADNHDPAAREDFALAEGQAPELNAHVRDVGLYLLGFGVCLVLAKRVR